MLRAELEAWIKEQGLPSFRVNQILEWVYRKGALSFEAMTNLSAELRGRLSERFPLPLLKQEKVQYSEDGETIKFLWALEDGKRVESVMIGAPDRRTVCVSSQVGCPARCAFCASGKEGLVRNLSAREIVAQVLQIDGWLQEKGERVTHVVFMGMGEPLANYEAVVEAVRALVAPWGMGLSQRRVTVSTVGVVEGIDRLAAEEDLRVNLVLSLHAPNQNLRKKIIPFARKYELEELLDAMDRYGKKTGRDITFEYTMLAGLNDSMECADELVVLLRGKQCTVNLIPYNPIDGFRLKRPSGEVIEAFRERLEAGGLNVTWRYTKGKDIAAACGQLALIS